MLNAFFSDAANRPFLIALMVLIILSILVVLGTLTGALGDMDADVDIDTPGEHVLDFLGVSAIPSSIFVLLASTTFFLTGFITQWIAWGQSGKFLSGWIAVMPAILITVFALNIAGRGFKKIQFKEHTTAVHGDTFVGKTAIISGGIARVGLPAQGKLVDEHGQTHYILIEPALEADQFLEGTEVVLFERRGPKYFGVAANADALNQIDAEMVRQSIQSRQ